MSNRYEKKSKKGHGCLGAFVAFSSVLAVCIILLAFSTDVFDGLKERVNAVFYSQKYGEYVEKYAEEYSVEVPLVFAVIRTESGFHEDAESSVGARGLMQLMPETFSWLQEKTDDEPMSDDALFDPEINIKYGTFCLSLLLSDYDNVTETAVAAYNAGTTNVDNWLSDSRYSDDGITLKDIPYDETKRYVERILRSKSVYEKLYEGKK